MSCPLFSAKPLPEPVAIFFYWVSMKKHQFWIRKKQNSLAWEIPKIISIFENNTLPGNSRGLNQYKDVILPVYDRLISTMGFSILVRWHLYIESGPRCPMADLVHAWLIWVFSLHSALTLWGRDEMAPILQTTLSNAFSSMKKFEFWLKFHWNLSSSIQLTISQHWFR